LTRNGGKSVKISLLYTLQNFPIPTRVFPKFPYSNLSKTILTYPITLGQASDFGNSYSIQ